MHHLRSMRSLGASLTRSNDEDVHHPAPGDTRTAKHLSELTAVVSSPAGIFGPSFSSDWELSRNPSARRDESELIAGAQEETQHRFTRQGKLLGHRLAHVAEEAGTADNEEGIMAMMACKIHEYDLQMPTIRVDYSGLTVETDVQAGGTGAAGLLNGLSNVFKTLAFMTPKQPKLCILDNLKGVLLPGRPTLLLGPPGCGKTTYLKVLAGHYQHSAALKVAGSLVYNGAQQDDFVVERTAGFISQDDVHVPALTVLETLEFACVCQNGTGASSFFLPTELIKAYEKLNVDTPSPHPGTHEFVSVSMAEPAIPEDVIGTMSDSAFIRLMRAAVKEESKTLSFMREFGIAHTRDTPVGDAMLRGVSGGERKRVTTAEIAVGPKRLLLADEISTGLDTATLRSIIQSMARLCRTMQLTTVISLLQPPPEVVQLFDDIIIMAHRRIIYHGPVAEAVPFFNGLGFDMPLQKDISSFLQEVMTPSGQMEFSNAQLRLTCGIAEPVLPHHIQARVDLLMTVDVMEEDFWNSAPGLKMQGMLNSPMDPASGHPLALVTRPYALGPFEAFWIVLRHQLLMLVRNTALMQARLIQSIILGLIIGSLYWQLHHTTANSRNFFGALFTNILFAAMSQMPSLSTTIATKAVWYKYRDSKFYDCTTHAFACMFSSIPTAMADTALYSIIVYFMTGLYTSPSYFFTFYLIMASVAVNCSATFRVVGHWSPDGATANVYGGILLLVTIVLAGFAIVRESIPGYWIWAYWMSPFSWGLRSLTINEFKSPAWAFHFPPGSTSTAGDAALLSFNFYTETIWIWTGVAYLWGGTIAITLMSALGLQYCSGAQRVAQVADADGPISAQPGAAPQRGQPSSSAQSPSGPSGLLQRSFQVRRKTIAVTAAQVLAPILGPTEVAPVLRSSLPFEPITLVFQDLRYFVPNPSYTARQSARVQPKENAAGTVASADMGDVEAGPLSDCDMNVHDNSALALTKAAQAEWHTTTEVLEQLELLKGITGYVQPRGLLALMGGSGAGKTTLMDCVAGRKTVGRIEGNVWINGHAKSQRTFSRVCGYVEQMGVHTATMTVIEALQFSARLRLPSGVDDGQAKAYVEEVLDIVDMRDRQFDLTGIPGETGLSVDQRKRLSIAVELVANPSVVFMDEPTSGLDARSAAVVIRAVRDVARNNRSVIVTIHQPSVEIFQVFDSLLLLQRGGRSIYFGPLGYRSCQLIAYLEAVPGCVKIPAGSNPATWMLDVTGGGLGASPFAQLVDWPLAYAGSDLAASNLSHAQTLVAHLSATMPPMQATGLYTASFTVQFVALMKKFQTTYWRSPATMQRMGATIVFALFYGSLYYRAGIMPVPSSLVQVQNIMGIIYSSTQYVGMVSMMAVMPLMGMERVVYYREQASSMYSPWLYGLVSTLVDLPYLIVQVTLFVCIVYPMIHYTMTAGHFFFYYLITLESILFYTTFGVALVYITPTQDLAQLLTAGLNFIFNDMNGFTIVFPEMPVYYKWLNRLTPSTWILYALGADQLAGMDTPFSEPAVSTATTVGRYVTETFGYTFSFRPTERAIDDMPGSGGFQVAT